MHTEYRSLTLLNVFRQGLHYVGEQHKQAILGDRNSYIGMSDIAKYAECPRAAVAAKLFSQSDTLEYLLPLHRGHWFEQGVGDTLHALKLNILSQLEIRYTYENTPIRAHLDFTLVWDKPKHAVRVLEIKSMGNIPDIPYAAHEVQVLGQIGLLHILWKEPVFGLRSQDGAIIHEHMTFPQLCTAHFGLHLPNNPQEVSLEGWLLCLSMKEVRPFGPYVYDTQSLHDTLEYAHHLWTDMQALQHGSLSLANIPYAQGYYPLCGYCDFNAECPKFTQGLEQPQWNDALVKLDTIKQKRSTLDNQIKEIETALKQAHQRSCTKDWITTGDYRFRTTITAGRRTLDKTSLQEEMNEICASANIAPIDVEALLRRHEYEGSPCCRLSITALH